MITINNKCDYGEWSSCQVAKSIYLLTTSMQDLDAYQVNLNA